MVRRLPLHSHAQPSWPTPDPKRIAGNSLAIVVHVVALGVLMFPSTWSPPIKLPRTDTVPVLLEPMPPEPIQPTTPPPQPLPPNPTPTPTTQPQIRLPVALPDPAPLVEAGELPATPSVDSIAPESFDPGVPAMATLAYDVAPAPRYPRAALRAGHEGTVTLRVLVDETGRPIEVEVESSSGHRDLDRAARLQVLDHWRFHPAQREGRNVAAYALVPVVFSLP